MKLIPMSAVRVNLGRWKPVTGDVDPRKSLPAVGTLRKAQLWMEDKYRHIRLMLNSPAMTVAVSATPESAKVQTAQGRGSIEVFRRQDGMPASFAQLPFMMLVLDATAMTVEDMAIIRSMPGRSKAATVPTLVFGEHAVVEAVVKTLLGVLGPEWAGEKRVHTVVTGEKDMKYTACRKEMVTLVPTGNRVMKMPPVFIIHHAPTPAVGWMAVLGMLQWQWFRQTEEDEQSAEWIFVLGAEQTFPVLLSTMLRNTPSVVYCPIHSEGTMTDVGAHC